MTDDSHHKMPFRSLLAEFDFPALESAGGTIYGLWPDLTLAYFNLAWTTFAASNGGEPRISAEWNLNRSILDAIPSQLQPFFSSNYARCLQEGRPWEHTYDCSSSKHFRQFHMMAFPLRNAEGLLVVNSVRQESPHTWTPCLPWEQLYRTEHGIIVQCCHCRRTRRAGKGQIWDWVPAWVKAQPTDTSHGLCAPCYGFHYPPETSNSGGFAKPFRTTEEGDHPTPR